MAPEAYVIFSTDIGVEEEVAKAIAKINGVKKVTLVYGIYDGIAEIKAGTLDNMKKIREEMDHVQSMRSTFVSIKSTEYRKDKKGNLKTRSNL